MDIASAARGPLKHLLGGKRKDYEPSSSALIFYWGLDREFASLGLHNIFFSDDYKKEFHSIFSQKQIDDDPTVYVHISSKQKPDDAPKGSENWLVMVNAPYVENQDWDTMVALAREHIVKKLSQ